jgi:hypothetical protein
MLDPNPLAFPVRLLVCVGPRCDADGRGRALLSALQEALAGAAADPIELCARDCLRLCTREPIVRLEPAGEVFSNPSVEELLRCAGAAVHTQTP